MEKNKLSIDQWSIKILAGIQKASKKRVERSATKNEYLMVAYKDGKLISVTAKDLLKTL